MRLMGFKAFALIMILAMPVQAMDSGRAFYDKSNTILRQLQGNLYSLSQDRGTQAEFEQLLNQAKNEFDVLLHQEGLKLDVVKSYSLYHPHGDSLLHVFAFHGYYPLVDMLLKIDGLEELNGMTNGFGMLPIELAKARFNQFFAISYPEQMCDSISFVPLSIVAEVFYDSPIQPYPKTLELLKPQITNAAQSNRISSAYIRFLEHRQKILLQGSTYPKQINDAVWAQFNRHILEIRKINNLEEEVFLYKLNDIQKSLLTDIDNTSPYRYINRKNLLDYCKKIR